MALRLLPSGNAKGCDGGDGSRKLWKQRRKGKRKKGKKEKKKGVPLCNNGNVMVGTKRNICKTKKK